MRIQNITPADTLTFELPRSLSEIGILSVYVYPHVTQFYDMVSQDYYAWVKASKGVPYHASLLSDLPTNGILYLNDWSSEFDQHQNSVKLENLGVLQGNTYESIRLTAGDLSSTGLTAVSGYNSIQSVHYEPTPTAAAEDALRNLASNSGVINTIARAVVDAESLATATAVKANLPVS